MSGWLWIRLGAILGALAVAIGAFGAHGLKDRLEALHTTATFETAAHYHLIHALALVGVGLVAVAGRSGPAVSVAGWGFTLGVLFFSGSLYALAVTGIKMFGAITPIGGVAFIVGWIALAVTASGSAVKP
jgi:uncharacterized membrane protein YgdD (TMEM256/DUF423 family)